MVIKTSQPANTRWRRQPGERPDQLLAAAQELFAVRGVAATSVDAITAAAGVAKGSFYRYFASKDELLAELKRRFFSDMAERAGEAVRATGASGGFAMLEVGIVSAVEFLFDNVPLLRVWNQAGDADASFRATTEATLRLVELFEVAIADGVEAGEFDCDDAHATALLLVYAIQGAATSTALRGCAGTIDTLIVAALSLTRRALGVVR